jgi:hypothetical protein
MNNHPTFHKTCIATLLLAGCCSTLADPASPPNAVAQDSVESQTTAPAVTSAPPAAVTATGQVVPDPVADGDSAAALSPQENGMNADAAITGEGQVPGTLHGEPETAEMGQPVLDSGDAESGDTGSPDGPEASASPVAAINPEVLYGEWTVKEQHPDVGEVVTLFSINSDSSFAGTMTVAGNVVWSYSGNWYLDGNLITWFYTESTPPLMMVDETEVDEVISVDSEKLVYRSGKRDTLETLYRAN